MRDHVLEPIRGARRRINPVTPPGRPGKARWLRGTYKDVTLDCVSGPVGGWAPIGTSSTLQLPNPTQ